MRSAQTLVTHHTEQHHEILMGDNEIGHYKGQQGWCGGTLLRMPAINFTPSSLVVS